MSLANEFGEGPKPEVTALGQCDDVYQAVESSLEGALDQSIIHYERLVSILRQNDHRTEKVYFYDGGNEQRLEWFLYLLKPAFYKTLKSYMLGEGDWQEGTEPTDLVRVANHQLWEALGPDELSGSNVVRLDGQTAKTEESILDYVDEGLDIIHAFEKSQQTETGSEQDDANLDATTSDAAHEETPAINEEVVAPLEETADDTQELEVLPSVVDEAEVNPEPLPIVSKAKQPTQKPLSPASKTSRRAHSPAESSGGNIRVADDEDYIKMYLKEIGRYPLLTKEDEVELAQAIEAGLEARAKFEGIDPEELSPVQRAEYRRAIRTGERAKERFINTNLRLVVSIAKRYQGKGLELLDLIQEGNLGLEHAVGKFDWHKGFKFSTYATWWIRQSITRSLANKGRAIRLPVHMHEDVKALSQAKRNLRNYNVEPTFENLMQELDMDADRLKKVLEASQLAYTSSLDEPIGNAGNSARYGAETTVGDLTPDKTANDLFAERETSVTLGDMQVALRQILNEREYQIIVMRFGLDGNEPQTLEQVGGTFCLTRERIRQIEARGMCKLRHPAASIVLGSFRDAFQD